MAHMMQVLHNCVLENEKRCIKSKIILYRRFMRRSYVLLVATISPIFYPKYFPNIPDKRPLFLSFADDGKGSLRNPSLCMPLRDITSSYASMSPPVLDFLCWSVF